VLATIIEPLREDWRNVQAAAEKLEAEGRPKDAAEAVRQFHRQLCATRVLDPACGTGNFLYVALELMKRLEGEVLESLLDLGGQEALALEKETIDPHQFLGLEINPRAVAITELVLWIGFLQWHFRTKGEAPGEPILQAFKNIRFADAVLTWDGWPVPKIVDGKETYPNARRPEWPEAEFIVGNPPFIGGKDVRSRVGDGYAETLWRVHKHVNASADFVMYWWDRAAELLTRKGTALRRFGLVTTNSITQVFQRRVVERHLKARRPVSLRMAIPDHPWTKATVDSAAVRIAMTVAEAGQAEGTLREAFREQGLDTDEPHIEFATTVGTINSDLTVGVDATAARSLRSNIGLCSRGIIFLGEGFLLSPNAASHLGLGAQPGIEERIKVYMSGKDLVSRVRGLRIIDLDGLSGEEVRVQYPSLYAHLASTVRPIRQENREKYRRDNWWLR
jgi:SAM-dependent methyltransferase